MSGERNERECGGRSLTVIREGDAVEIVETLIGERPPRKEPQSGSVDRSIRIRGEDTDALVGTLRRLLYNKSHGALLHLIVSEQLQLLERKEALELIELTDGNHPQSVIVPHQDVQRLITALQQLPEAT